MTNEQFLKNLQTPSRPIDVVLDTDAYNEVDDRYAIAYLLKNKDKLNTKAIYAAPFFSPIVASPEEGMEKSYGEIVKILKIMKEDVPVFKGCKTYLYNEDSFVNKLHKELGWDLSKYKGLAEPENPTQFVDSPAVRDLVARAKNYSPENPLYVVGIASITNIASAILMDKSIIENIVVVWLGGKGRHCLDAKEYNLVQDYNAVRTVMNSGVPFVQLPCLGVVSHFKISRLEIEKYLLGKSEIADYLAKETISSMDKWAQDTFWTTTLHDVVAIGWLLNKNELFMYTKIANVSLPNDQGFYAEELQDKKMRYVYFVQRDPLMKDMLVKIAAD